MKGNICRNSIDMSFIERTADFWRVNSADSLCCVNLNDYTGVA